MNAWYQNAATAILHALPDLDTDDIRVSLRDKRVIAAILTMRRDGSNWNHSVFEYGPDDPGRVETR